MSLLKRPSLRQRRRNGAIWLGAFGSIFFLVGLGFLVLAVVPTVFDTLRMRQWEPVAAQLGPVNTFSVHLRQARS